MTKFGLPWWNDPSTTLGGLKVVGPGLLLTSPSTSSFSNLRTAKFKLRVIQIPKLHRKYSVASTSSKPELFVKFWLRPPLKKKHGGEGTNNQFTTQLKFYIRAVYIFWKKSFTEVLKFSKLSISNNCEGAVNHSRVLVLDRQMFSVQIYYIYWLMKSGDAYLLLL